MAAHLPVTSPNSIQPTDARIIGGISRATFTPVGDNEIYVWGVRNQAENFFVLNRKSLIWREVESTSATPGSSPGPRHAHTVTYFELDKRSYLVLYGGYDDELEPRNSVHIYDIALAQWIYQSSPNTDPHCASARSFHTATYVSFNNEPYLFVVGGLHMRDNRGGPGDNARKYVLPELCVLNLRTRLWYPAAYVLSRYHHSTILIPAPSPRILVIGGRDSHGTHCTMHYFIDVAATIETVVAQNDRVLAPAQIIDSQKQTPRSGALGTSVQKSVPRRLWTSVSHSSETIGPFHGYLWLASHHDTIYILGQTPPLISSSSANTSLFPEATVSSLRIAMWALTLDNGSLSFEELPLISEHLRNTGIGATWLWLDVFDTGVRVLDPTMEDESSDRLVESEKMLFGLSIRADLLDGVEIMMANGSAVPQFSEHDMCHVLPIPLASLPSEYRSSKSEYLRPFIPDSFSNRLSFALHLPPLWHPSINPQPRPLSKYSLELSDFTVRSGTEIAPPFSTHSLILSTRSTYFRTLLSSGLHESSSRQITLDEPYIVVYSLLHYLYTDALPGFLTIKGIPLHTVESDLPIMTNAEDGWAPDAGKIASALLVAANKYLVPQSLVVTLRNLILTRLITPSCAIWMWRAAWLTRPETNASSVDGVSLRFRRVDDANHEWTAGSSAENRDGSAKGWITDVLCSAFVGQERERPAETFFRTVSRWCRKRLEDIRDADESDMDEDMEWNVRAAFWADMDGGGARPEALTSLR